MPVDERPTLQTPLFQPDVCRRLGFHEIMCSGWWPEVGYTHGPRA